LSDNGYMLGNHGQVWKVLMWEESIRIPLIVNWRSRFEPRVVDELCTMMDIMPTIMDIAGIPVPQGIAGKSLLPLLEGKDVELHKEVFCEHYDSAWRAVRTKEWKYIGTPERGDELYHIKDDPLEMRNLADDPRYSDVLRDLRDRWNRWMKEVGMPSLTQEDIDRAVKLIKESNYSVDALEAIGGMGIKLPDTFSPAELKGIMRTLKKSGCVASSPQAVVGMKLLIRWMEKLHCEGRTTPNLHRLFGELKDAFQGTDESTFEKVATAFFKELLRCELGG